MKTLIALACLVVGWHAAVLMRPHGTRLTHEFFVHLPPETDPAYPGPRFREWKDGVEVTQCPTPA